MNVAERAEYDRTVEFAAGAIFVLDRLTSRAHARFFECINRAIELRGGFVDDGRYVRVEIGRDVMAEIAERGVRLMAVELGKCSTLPDDARERVEHEMSNMCARALARIREQFAP